MHVRTVHHTAIGIAAFVLMASGLVKVLHAQLPDLPRELETLRGHVPPDPPNLADFVRDRQAAIALGKAFFWEMQAGSDEQTACATCHYAAGADHRVRSRMHPGPDAFDRTLGTRTTSAALAPTGPNYTPTAADFPFHVLSNPDDRESPVTFSSNDVLGSQGIFQATFAGLAADGKEILTPAQSATFRVGAAPNLAQVRRVTSRHAPTVINAAFNHRNFWDGRANNVFNGVNPWGLRDPSAVVWVNRWVGSCMMLVAERVGIPNAAAASQAVAPPVSDVEMSATGRRFPDIGRKLLRRKPLALQRVEPTDSVLGAYADPSGFGLSVTYAQLIEKAFVPMWWNSAENVPRTAYTHMEGNFSLFWGLAIQLYEATLISDDAPIDRFIQGQGTLTADERAGMEIFTTKAECVSCHGGPEFTVAAKVETLNERVGGLLELMSLGDGGVGLYDAAFYNVGIRPTSDDRLQGGLDPFGNPLSFTRQSKIVMQGGAAADRFTVDTCTFERSTCQPLLDPNIRDAVDGAAKVPTLRNIELTAPYFHTGGYGTLEQVVDFYSRGGNTRAHGTGDTSGLSPNPSNFAFDMIPFNFTADERRQLVAFLKTLTDPRVRDASAPFDHPSLRVPDGHPGDASSTPIDGSGRALDRWIDVPAVGANGRAAAGLAPVEPWTPAAERPAPAGLVAGYSFDDASAAAADASVKENHGIANGATFTPGGRFGGAMAFAGSGAVHILSSASLSLTNRFTLAAWVSPASAGSWRSILTKEVPGASAYALYAQDGNGRPAAYLRSAGTDYAVTGPGVLPAGQWTHLAATYDGATFRLFVNGVQAGAAAVKAAATVSALPLRIGASARGENFQGTLDEVRLYNRALTAAEVAAVSREQLR